MIEYLLAVGILAANSQFGPMPVAKFETLEQCRAQGRVELKAMQDERKHTLLHDETSLKVKFFWPHSNESSVFVFACVDEAADKIIYRETIP